VRQRRCKDCKELFATPASFVNHRRIGGACRSVENLPDAGFIKTANGWYLDKLVREIRSKKR
jgi:hypothetical protein